MPYIAAERRRVIDRFGELPQNSGELNYLLTVCAKDYIETHGLSYQTIADVTSAFDNAKAEFYRRVAAPYEDTKIAANGDVY